jgi:hypothetical protein
MKKNMKTKIISIVFVLGSLLTLNGNAQINAGTIGDSLQNVCYNDTVKALVFITNPSGGGEEATYTYQWQDSIDSASRPFGDIDGATDSIYQPKFIQGICYYRVIVSSGDSSDTTNTVTVIVYPEFVTGEIVGTDTICPNQETNLLTITQNCSGADGNYSYQWQYSTDNEIFTEIQDANDTIYQPKELEQTTYYRLQFTSDSGCDVLYSNTVKIWVISAPTERTLIGKREVCNNTYDLEYFFTETEENIVYQWNITGGEICEQIDDSHVIVHWNDKAGDGILTLVQTNTLAHYSFTTNYTIIKTENSAPDKTLIIRKRDSNILICADTTATAHYQWGFIDSQTKKDSLMQDKYGNYRYFEMPHIDTNRYKYFVEIRYGDNGCTTRSYYETETQPTATNIQQITVFPNPAKEHFSLSLGTAFTGKVLVSLKNLSGATLLTKQIADYKNNEVVQFDLNLPDGIYLLVVQTNENVLTSKVVIK